LKDFEYVLRKGNNQLRNSNPSYVEVQKKGSPEVAEEKSQEKIKEEQVQGEPERTLDEK